jgi:alanine dehydrogenase
MPGAVAHTSTYALTNATFPYIVKLADKGLDALREDESLRKGLNVAMGDVTLEAIATQFGYPYVPTERALSGAAIA